MAREPRCVTDERPFLPLLFFSCLVVAHVRFRTPGSKRNNENETKKVLRMASAMTEHLRSLHPALAPGRAAAGGQPSCWAHRIVYSVGSFDRPKLYPGGVEPAAATAAIPPLPVTLGNDGNGKKGHSCSSSLAYANSIATPVDGRLPSSPHPAAASGGGGSGGGASTAPSPFSPPHGGHAVAMAEAAVAEATVEGSRLRFLREFGAIVIVGVYSDAAHAACHGGVAPVETFRDRVARVSPHADSVVAIDSPNSACVLDTLLRASANIAASVAAITTAGAGGSLGARGVISGDPGCRNGLISVAGRGSFFSGSTVDGACRGAAAAGLARDMNGEGAAAEVGPQGVGMGMGYYCPPQGIDVGVPPPPPAPKSFFESVNCCFVTCDWEGMGAGWTEEGRRVRRATVAIMRQSMPVFPLPSPTWGRGFDEQGDAEEEADGPARRYW